MTEVRNNKELMPPTAHQRQGRGHKGRNNHLLACSPKIDPDGSASFRHTRQMLVPHRPGVYLLHDLRGVLYVGATRNLYQRFHQHYWLTANDLIELAMSRPLGDLTFSWFLVDDARQRAAFERALIGWLRPACNRAIPIGSFSEGE